MFRFLAYVLVGYMFYEMVQGMMSPGQGESHQQVHPGDIELVEPPNIGAMTGGGRGQRVRTEDASGESVPHAVGRGVL